MPASAYQPRPPGKPQHRLLWRWVVLVAVPLVVAVEMYCWQCRRETAGGLSAAEWSLRLMSGDQRERTQAQEALRELGSNAVPSLVRAFGRKPPVFRGLVVKFVSMAPARIRDTIHRKLLYPDPLTARMAAGHALVVLGPYSVAALPELLAAVVSPDPTTSWQAGEVLGSIGAAAVPGLLPLLGHPDPMVRQRAANALGQIGPAADNAIPALISAIADTNQNVAGSSLFALMRLWTNPVAQMSNLLVSAPDPARLAALRAVPRLTSLPARVPQTAVAFLLEDKSAEVRLAGVQVLGQLTAWSPATFIAICRRGTDDVPEVRAAVVELMSAKRVRGRITPANLGLVLEVGDVAAQIEAARVLGIYGSVASNTLPQLLRLCSSANSELAQQASEAVGRITNAVPR